MMKQFGKQPGCERYATDGARLKMLVDYLWCRQLAPGLPFETFLQRFAPLACFDELNRLHPEDAMHYFCPRSKKQAEEQGMPQWAANEVVEFTALYVDMIREAEAQGIEPPLTYAQFLEQLGPAYRSGQLTPPPEPAQARVPAETKPKRTKAAAGDAIPAPPVVLAVGTRGVYTIAGKRQVRGQVTNITEMEGRPYADFLADDGENFHGVNMAHIAPVEPGTPPAKTVDPRLIKERQKLWIPKAQTPQVLSMLALEQPAGNVEVGAVLYPFMQGYTDGKAASLNVVNGQTGPYVDAQLVNQATDEVLADCPPRKNICGEYTFMTDEGAYVLEVCTRD